MLKFILFITMFFFSSHHSGDAAENEFISQRLQMVEHQIKRRGIKDPRVLAAMQKVPRHLFVPSSYRNQSYEDHPLPIGKGQTISQPFIVSVMTELLELDGSEKVLEIGTGSGYQAAILAELAKEVYTVEIINSFADESKKLLQTLGYENVHVFWGDGYKGWPEHAPYDAIIVTAAPKKIPQALVDQLKEGGRLVIPVGHFYQKLKLVIKQNGRMIEKNIVAVNFVPMVHPSP
ncbi:MAG: protein-L-isoaspartate(D-aspartate) O-methyltransferase [Candidatus Omnitrophica bacterium]|nr:protein-L-isoaspartate(D-aspartate) O-methyltransferase [Candidatus Omnitrophota bacterium]